MTTTLTKTSSVGQKLFTKQPGQNYIDLIKDFFDNAKVAQADISDISELRAALDICNENTSSLDNKVKNLQNDYNNLMRQLDYEKSKKQEEELTRSSTSTARHNFYSCPSTWPTDCPVDVHYTDYGPICYNPNTSTWDFGSTYWIDDCDE